MSRSTFRSAIRARAGLPAREAGALGRPFMVALVFLIVAGQMRSLSGVADLSERNRRVGWRVCGAGLRNMRRTFLTNRKWSGGMGRFSRGFFPR